MTHAAASRREFLVSAACAAGLFPYVARAQLVAPPDDLSWLEDSASPRVREWIASQNAATIAELDAGGRLQRLEAEALAADADFSRGGEGVSSRTMALSARRVYHLNYTNDKPHGILRTSSLGAFERGRPEWIELLDIGNLSGQADEALAAIPSFLRESPDGRRLMVGFAIGGSGALRSWREFDLESGDFVPGGFALPAGDSSTLAWLDDDTLIVSADFGPGTVTLQSSPLTARKWFRGQTLNEAIEIYKAQPSDKGVAVRSDEHGKPGFAYAYIDHAINEDTRRQIRLTSDGGILPLPAICNSGTRRYDDYYVTLLRRDTSHGGVSYRARSVIAVPASELASDMPRIELVYEPAADETPVFLQATSSGFLVQGFYLAYSRTWQFKRSSSGWLASRVALPEQRGFQIAAGHPQATSAFVTVEGYDSPPRLYKINLVNETVVQHLDEGRRIDGPPLVSRLLWATSADGTSVPYTVVHREDVRFDGQLPVLVTAYGASLGVMAPSFSAITNQLWFARGGVAVFAHVRGGSERGNDWHVTGVGRRHTYADTIAVAEDLIHRGVTRRKKLGILGWSNGGLLAAVVMNQRPDLWGAVILKAPMLDQFRLDLAVGRPEDWFTDSKEYGDIRRPEVRAFIEQTSPFQNLQNRPGMPRPLILTASNDANVYPAQPRRFAEKMSTLNLPFLFYEFPSGGHGLSVTAQERARVEAMIYAYLHHALMAE